MNETGHQRRVGQKASGWCFEADESYGSFVSLEPEVAAVLTIVEPDHLDHYSTFEALTEAFAHYPRLGRPARVVGADDAVAAWSSDCRLEGIDAVGSRP